MAANSESNPSPAASDAWEVLEDCVYAFEQDYHAGKRQPLDAYLPVADMPTRQMVLIELIKVDLELQWKDGSHVSLEEYCGRYDGVRDKKDLPPDLSQ